MCVCLCVCMFKGHDSKGWCGCTGKGEEKQPAMLLTYSLSYLDTKAPFCVGKLAHTERERDSFARVPRFNSKR